MEAFANLCLDMSLGFVLLLPIHEGMHGLAYRSLGASNVRVVNRWRSLTAYCAADRFVVGGRTLAWVGIAPFLVLNSILLIATLITPGVWPVLFAGALFLHVGACSGDVGLLNWLWLRGTASTLSYDDTTAGKSYFFTPIAADVDAVTRAKT